MSSVADQSLLLQAWIMISTNPEIIEGIEGLPLAYDAGLDVRREKALQVCEKIYPGFRPTDNALDMIAASLKDNDPAVLAPPVSNYETLVAARFIYQQFGANDWPGEPPHPKGEDLLTFFVKDPVAATVGDDSPAEGDTSET